MSLKKYFFLKGKDLVHFCDGDNFYGAGQDLIFAGLGNPFSTVPLIVLPFAAYRPLYVYLVWGLWWWVSTFYPGLHNHMVCLFTFSWGVRISPSGCLTQVSTCPWWGGVPLICLTGPLNFGWWRSEATSGASFWKAAKCHNSWQNLNYIFCQVLLIFQMCVHFHFL